jgi:hypothetical protein
VYHAYLRLIGRRRSNIVVDHRDCSLVVSVGHNHNRVVLAATQALAVCLATSLDSVLPIDGEPVDKLIDDFRNGGRGTPGRDI